MKINVCAKLLGEDQAGYIPATRSLTIDMVNHGGTGSLTAPEQFELTVTNTSAQRFCGVIKVDFQFGGSDADFYMPAFMYGTNRGDTTIIAPDKYPRIRPGKPAMPTSPWWLVRGDRLSHPTVMAVDQHRLVGLIASPYLVRATSGRQSQWHPGIDAKFSQYCGYGIDQDTGTISYTLGYENAPWLFVQAADVRPRLALTAANCLVLEAGEQLTIRLDWFDFEAADKLAVHQVIQVAYTHFHEAPRDVGDVHTAVRDIATAIARDAYDEKQMMYNGMRYWDGRVSQLGSFSWTNGLTVAVPQLLAGRRLGDARIRQQALTVIQNIVTHALNPASGLPYDGYENGRWSLHGWWFDRVAVSGHAGYLIGQGVYELLKAVDFERTDHAHPDWLSFAEKVLAKASQMTNHDAEFPYIYAAVDGSGLEYDSLGSCWVPTAMAYLVYLTGNREHLALLQRSEQHYYQRYVAQLDCYGGPLDTSKAPDNEGILAYIRWTKLMHQLTGDERYLQHMQAALAYEFSFKFSYNSPVQYQPLKRLGWSSCGGSVTSVCNPHIHPMSSTIIDEMAYYQQQTGDPYVAQRLQDTIAWGKQSYNRIDGEYDYGYRGWMSERFCYSQGLLAQKYPDGTPSSTWFVLLPWAGASVIEGYVGTAWNEK